MIEWSHLTNQGSRYAVMIYFNFELSNVMVWESSYESLNIYYEYKGVHLNKDTL